MIMAEITASSRHRLGVVLLLPRPPGGGWVGVDQVEEKWRRGNNNNIKWVLGHLPPKSKQ
jgi:hypothetical protein